MERFVFKSLEKPDEMAYVWHRTDYDTEWRYDSRRDVLVGNAGWYQTYGDGMCQHSGEMPVGRERAVDYLASLGAYLNDAIGTTDFFETLKCLDYDWPKPECHTGRKQVVWALGVKHKDNKRQWLNKNDCKVSAAESKRHDKRWDEVVQWMDGTTKSALGICNMSHYQALDTYALAVFIDNVSREEHGHGDSNRTIAEHTGFVQEDDPDWDTARRTGNLLNQAYHCVDYFVGVYRKMEHATSAWGCLQNNYCRNVLGHEPVEA